MWHWPFGKKARQARLEMAAQDVKPAEAPAAGQTPLLTQDADGAHREVHEGCGNPAAPIEAEDAEFREAAPIAAEDTPAATAAAENTPAADTAAAEAETAVAENTLAADTAAAEAETAVAENTPAATAAAENTPAAGTAAADEEPVAAKQAVREVTIDPEALVRSRADRVPRAAEEEKIELPDPPRSLYAWTKSRQKKKRGPRRGGAAKAQQATVQAVQVGRVRLGAGPVKICVPVTGASDDAALAQAQAAVAAGADIIEWRADCYEHIFNKEAAGALLAKLKEAAGDIPLLFTFRTRREGGAMETDAASYQALACWAAGRAEVDAIDIEGLSPDIDTEVLVGIIRDLGKAVIASAHFFDRTPKKAEIRDIYEKLSRTGADVLKLAVMPKKDRDVLRLMSGTLAYSEESARPLIAMAMGDLGRISRIAGASFHSCLTFAAAAETSAPGQLPVADVRRALELLQ